MKGCVYFAMLLHSPGAGIIQSIIYHMSVYRRDKSAGILRLSRRLDMRRKSRRGKDAMDPKAKGWLK